MQPETCFSTLVCGGGGSGTLGLPELKQAARWAGLSGEASSDHALLYVLKRNVDSGEVSCSSRKTTAPGS